ncbi:DnaJ domain-containing protein [Corallococcus silvisoli]|uniref:DnaJ domain-containing protein n=1 Tax=Corallococcus silvisoli TaxID=2697031 RepID=UPI0013777F7A|nr:DnaJ domain-containing protein [Corallococcus silvisoli]NBD11598.1 DnaJ domain-containing protein [Corallococcus silvisoli]
MNNEPRPNPYEVLGIERDADTRAIKKAYFERVRQNPPETHPEVFKRLREAYELLSDPEARQAFDASSDAPVDGPEAVKNAQLQEAIDLFDADDKAGGRKVLKALLTEQPDFHEARLLLGRNLLFENEAKEALEEFDALIARAPGHWQAHLYRGWALNRLDRLKEAADSFWRAGKHGPSEVSPRVALADCLEAMGQVPDALDVLAQAQALPGVSRMDVLALKVRRIATMLEYGQEADAAKELEQLDAELPEDADPELRRWAGGQLSAAAAHLFSQQKSQGANRLLEFGRRFNPESATEVSYPTRVTVDMDALPAITREWLHSEAERVGGWRTLWTGLKSAAVTLALVTATCFLLAHISFGTSARGVSDWVWCALYAAVFCGVTYAWARHFLRVMASPYARFNTIHPLHLVQIDIDHITVWPLVHLQDLKLVNHQRNGVYQHTALELRFNNERMVLTVHGKDKAEAQAQELIARRRRVLELLGRGMLDAESGVEHLPPALLAQADKRGHVRAQRARSPWPGVFAAAGVGVLLAGGAVWQQTRSVQAHAWMRVAARSDLGSMLEYLRDSPDSRFAPRIQALVDAQLAQARARLDARLDPDSAAAPSRPFFESLLDAVSRDHRRRITVVWKAPAEDDALPVRDDPSESLVVAWQRTVDEVLGTGVLVVDGGWGRSREEPPLLTLHVRDESRGASGTQRVWSVTQEGLAPDGPARALELVADAADPRASEVLFHAWVDAWHLPGARQRHPLLLTTSTLAQEAQP